MEPENYPQELNHPQATILTFDLTLTYFVTYKNFPYKVLKMKFAAPFATPIENALKCLRDDGALAAVTASQTVTTNIQLRSFH